MLKKLTIQPQHIFIIAKDDIQLFKTSYFLFKDGKNEFFKKPPRFDSVQGLRK